TRAT
ncbi:hypothetical protein D041_0338B, partial [Vibrio parahaemolyticus EKP-008]